MLDNAREAVENVGMGQVVFKTVTVLESEKRLQNEMSEMDQRKHLNYKPWVTRVIVINKFVKSNVWHSSMVQNIKPKVNTDLYWWDIIKLYIIKRTIQRVSAVYLCSCHIVHNEGDVMKDFFS